MLARFIRLLPILATNNRRPHLFDNILCIVLVVFPFIFSHPLVIKINPIFTKNLIKMCPASLPFLVTMIITDNLGNSHSHHGFAASPLPAIYHCSLHSANHCLSMPFGVYSLLHISIGIPLLPADCYNNIVLSHLPFPYRCSRLIFIAFAIEQVTCTCVQISLFLSLLSHVS